MHADDALVEPNVPERVERAYKSAVQNFNAQDWRGVLNECRQLLEAYLNWKLNPRPEKLTEAVDALFKNGSTHLETMVKNAKQTASAVRVIGNFGSHDNDGDPDKNYAKLALQFVRDFVYLFDVLPEVSAEVANEVKKQSTVSPIVLTDDDESDPSSLIE